MCHQFISLVLWGVLSGDRSKIKGALRYRVNTPYWRVKAKVVQ
ncbi:hypothetical protein [Dendronalium sp. ChiSLP03b]|nr:hypothetical protein [Dendronalium sp. ChiSLP03b]MDZ8207039.1 hypothetical protein [Dendronalium sp. ChiSLP03b]